jgi:hypothetical protein
VVVSEARDQVRGLRARPIKKQNNLGFCPALLKLSARSNERLIID